MLWSRQENQGLSEIDQFCCGGCGGAADARTLGVVKAEESKWRSIRVGAPI